VDNNHLTDLIKASTFDFDKKGLYQIGDMSFVDDLMGEIYNRTSKLVKTNGEERAGKALFKQKQSYNALAYSVRRYLKFKQRVLEK
jgi:hypothetical protein